MKHNQYLHKTLLLSIILGILPIIPVLGFSTNSFITNSFITNSFTTTTTTKPINLISNISPVANLQSYTNTTTTNNYSNVYVNNNSVSSFQSQVSQNSFTTPTTTKPINLISNISPVANLQSYTNTNYIPQNNNNYSNLYVQNNSITQLQSSVPNSLISNISSTIPAFPNVVAYTSPISNISNTSHIFNTINLNTNIQTNIPDSKPTPNNISNLLLNNNQLLTSNSQLSQSSLNSFQLFKPLDTKLYQDNTSLITNSNNEINDNTIKPQIAPKPDKLKPNYLILVNKNSDKPLYDKYIEDRKYDYNMRIVSLEERGIPNSPISIKGLLKDTYNSWKFTYLALDENIPWGNINIQTGPQNESSYSWSDTYQQKRRVLTFPSDFFYANLDNDINFVPEIFPGRISKNFLQTNWINLSEPKLMIALTPEHYDHILIKTNCCGIISTKESNVDSMAFDIQEFANNILHINTETYLETRSSYRRYNKKPNYSLNYNNIINGINTNNIIVMNSTLEPLIKRPEGSGSSILDFSRYTDFYTSVWIDKDKDQFVDQNNQEITTIDAFLKQTTDIRPLKRIVLIPTLYPVSNFNFYNAVLRRPEIVPWPWFLQSNVIGPIGKEYSYSAIWRHILEEILYGKSISEAVYMSYNLFAQKYGESAIPASFYVSGPPETTINDLIDIKPAMWYNK